LRHYKRLLLKSVWIFNKTETLDYNKIFFAKVPTELAVTELSAANKSILINSNNFHVLGMSPAKTWVTETTAALRRPTDLSMPPFLNNVAMRIQTQQPQLQQPDVLNLPPPHQDLNSSHPLLWLASSWWW